MKKNKKKRIDPLLDAMDEMVKVLKESYSTFNDGLEQIIKERDARK